jgi:DNA-binding CsgD family transcriptional regulator
MGKIEQVRSILKNPFGKYPNLSEQEERVLRLASRGLTNREIALGEMISEEMVAYVLRNGLLKTGSTKKTLPNKVFSMIEEIVG